MDRGWLWLVVAVLVGSVLVTMLGGVERQRRGGVVRWEYKAIVISGPFALPDHTEKIQPRLNELGREGWELVGFEQPTYILKRRLQD